MKASVTQVIKYLRAPLQGDPGKDAVLYRIVPSYTSVRCVHTDGVLTPTVTSVSFRVTKKKGSDSPVTVKDLAAEGIVFSWSYIDNNPLAHPYEGPVEVDPDLAGINAWIHFGGQIVDTVTVPFIIDGEPGENGSDGVSYSVVITPSAVSIAADGTVLPAEDVTAKAYRNVGGVISEATDGHMVRRTVRTNGIKASTAVSNLLHGSIANMASVVFEYRVGSVAVASAALTINREGGRGSRGPSLRGPQAWSDCADSYAFMQGAEGEAFIDVVVYKDGYYLCIKSHEKSDATAPLVDGQLNTEFWAGTKPFDIVATKLLLAEYALIHNLGAEAIEMKDAEGNILVSIKDGAVLCRTGSFTNVSVSGELVGVTGSFRTLECLDSNGSVVGRMTFSDNGSMTFEGDIWHQGAHSSGRAFRFYGSDIWCRGVFGAAERSTVIIEDTMASFFENGLSRPASAVSLTAKADGGETYYEVPTYRNGFAIDTVVFRCTAERNYCLTASAGKRVLLVNANDDCSVYVYSNGNKVLLVGGAVREAIMLGSHIRPVKSYGTIGAGLLLGAEYDNNW